MLCRERNGKHTFFFEWCDLIFLVVIGNYVHFGKDILMERNQKNEDGAKRISGKATTVCERLQLLTSYKPRTRCIWKSQSADIHMVPTTVQSTITVKWCDYQKWSRDSNCMLFLALFGTPEAALKWEVDAISSARVSRSDRFHHSWRWEGPDCASPIVTVSREFGGNPRRLLGSAFFELSVLRLAYYLSTLMTLDILEDQLSVCQ